MTPEREQQIIAMAKADFLRGVGRTEVEYFEQKYKMKCTSYTCGGCILSFLRNVIKTNNL